MSLFIYYKFRIKCITNHSFLYKKDIEILYDFDYNLIDKSNNYLFIYYIISGLITVSNTFIFNYFLIIINLKQKIINKKT